MKYSSEKEKKLEIALDKLKKIDFKNNKISKNVTELTEQKNQLEIEKNGWKKKFKDLSIDHVNLQEKLKEIRAKSNDEKLKQIKFNEKIDELNQETDTLLNEIEKWQM
tara:strand:+ start:1200 stop:1523 length:324 start_codon:yes stop_codon:yes gene_type:complete